ncbi:MAG: hypothetical protein AUJ07_08730 [Crenarchaeota archaeon 13_1_40CM_3_53_5]|nr:MAG: hypothetical protein AUJ07_08730 [Crenarchaeota archaeon 13_1_40CM_3_53_5]
MTVKRGKSPLVLVVLFLMATGLPNLVAPVHAVFIIDSTTLAGGSSYFGYFGVYPARWGEIGQCFTTPTVSADPLVANGLQITQVKFYISSGAGSPSGTVQAFLFATAGTYGSSCVPSGPVLASSVNVAIIPINGYTTNFQIKYNARPNTLYAISLRINSCSSCDLNNYWQFQFQSPASNNIARWEGSSYSAITNGQATYEIDGDYLPPAPTTNWLDIFNSSTVGVPNWLLISAVLLVVLSIVASSGRGKKKKR